MTPHRAQRAVAAWLRDRRAATAVIFALAITPVLGFVALAVDVGSAISARSQLDLAADAAALTAVMSGTAALAADPNASLKPAQQAGAARFRAEAGSTPRVALTALTIAVTHTGGTVTASATYGASYQTWFAGLFGFSRIPLGGSAAATRTNSPFFDIEIMTDGSSSMAIAATLAGMARLGALVERSPLFAANGQGQACAFGCHFDPGNNDFYGLAKANGVQLRIDVLNQAVQNVIATIMRSAAATQFRVGLYTFAKALTTIYPLGGDLAGAAVAARSIQVPVTTQGNAADTNLPQALQDITALTDPAGDGSSQSSPRKFLFIITDGVADYYNTANARIMAPLDPAGCAALKSKGVQILTLYTTYIPIAPPNVPTANAFYVDNIQPFIADVEPNLAACASSPDFAFVASDPAAIDAALQAMLQAAVASPARFTH